MPSGAVTVTSILAVPPAGTVTLLPSVETVAGLVVPRVGVAEGPVTVTASTWDRS